MTYPLRAMRPLGAVSSALRSQGFRGHCRQLSTSTRFTNYYPASAAATSQNRTRPIASFHTTSRRRKRERDGPPPTDFGALDVLGNTPAPSTSVDICMSEGFQLNSGVRITDGSGVLLIDGEAFKWQPWLVRGEKRLLNSKGQWEVPNESLAILDLLWPRPGKAPLHFPGCQLSGSKGRVLTYLADLLILGLGPEIRPISPEVRRYISSLGIRVEVLDTRNAAAQFNLLATERGVSDVVAALIPIGWREGTGADW
ncbi:NADH dehydrogenase 1 alpha subcomplex assembly factor 3 [Biscogniauxia sp. FL1348]|nr:NADH dehydrogenase 1 alpha subcomplex assembly factor 3 [Biscogniauxia sp. FL1348]